MNVAVSELPPDPVPKVSVSVTTFNHEAFISQALDGILMQDTDFPFEIIVGDDCSADRTRELVRGYQRQHPDRIRTVLPDRTLGRGGIPLFGETLLHARGAYIAMMDGDDFWTARHKLQVQVDFLEANPDHSMCFHEVAVLDDHEGKVVGVYTGAETEHADIWGRCYIASCSPVFRRASLLPLPSWYMDMEYGDWPLYMLASTRGKIGYINETMGTYRIHDNGIWSQRSQSSRLRGIISFYLMLKQTGVLMDAKSIDRYIFVNNYRLFRALEDARDFPAAYHHAMQCLSSLPDSRLVPSKKLVRMAIKAMKWRLSAKHRAPSGA
jgi:glycosyltransferase involved in cell wall biosynthesis